MLTAFTQLAGCRLPVQLAPMGGVGAAPELPAAVAEAGGHPVYPAVLLAAEALADGLDRLSQTTDRFGVNFIVPLIDDRALEVALGRAPMVDFFLGDPDPGLVRRVHSAGALASWQVGSRREAIAAAAAGCDLIVAQGSEAGGRIRGSVGLLALLEQVLDVVEVPVLAAGGIASARGSAAAIAAGAAGVRVGTRLIASEEANAHPAWKDALVDADTEETTVTQVFSRGVPPLPHRVLQRSIDAAESLDDDPVAMMDVGSDRVEVERFASHAPTGDAEGAIEAMPFYAGHSVGAIDSIRPAATIVAELAASSAEN